MSCFAMSSSSKGLAAVVAAVAVVVGSLLFSPKEAGAVVSRAEAKCAGKLAKGALKLAGKVLKEGVKCRNRGITSSSAQSCPDARAQSRIQGAKTQLGKLAEKRCGSVCSISQDLDCIADDLCPPFGVIAEQCSGGSSGQSFDIGDIGFPGPFCESALGHSPVTAGDLASCVGILTEQAGERFLDMVYGSTATGGAVSDQAARCLRAAAAGASKLVTRIFAGVAKCRNAINRGKRSTNPTTCATDDARLVSRIAKAEAKFRSLIAARCSSEALAELDLCGLGSGASLTAIQVEDCLIQAVHESADSTLAPMQRSTNAWSFIDAAFPPQPVCGDNLVNQLPDAFLPLGEECDGTDDSACPGACLPPGDMFECTCATIPRLRFFATVAGSETDAGWTGLGHNQAIADKSGFVADLENCNCDGFSDATCTGTTTDPLCDVRGYQLPVCSWNLWGSQRCDDLGDGNGSDEDTDCFICGSFSANAGAFCRNHADCQSQCYDASGAVVGVCDRQSDCGSGQVCRGRCDNHQSCVVTTNGGPVPVNAAGASVCSVQTFRTDITGTRNMVTGEHRLSYRLFSRLHVGERTTRPCPVCGGFCVGGKNDLEVCTGRCAASGDPCRFDTDCASSDSCEPESPDCPGGICQLSLVCGSDPSINPGVLGKPCRIEFEHPVFGTLSSDCQPTPTLNISGQGLEVDYLPATSDMLTLPAAVPCTAPGFELFDCPCPDDGGQPTAPNTCTPACDAAGANFGVGCADGDGAGSGTVCAGGSNADRPCDEDSDCPGSSCSLNPRHCVGDAAFARFPCSSDADCGSGSCVDACPGGRCEPLCVPAAQDPLDGVCAAGPKDFHCNGEKFSFRTCSQETGKAGCAATCSASASPCTSASDCAPGESCTGECLNRRDCEAGPDGILGNADDLVGAGACVAEARSCFLDPIIAQGGSTLNGLADPTNYLTTTLFCFGATPNPGINGGSGFGGPGRIRVHGVNVPNFASIP